MSNYGLKYYIMNYAYFHGLLVMNTIYLNCD